MKALLLLLSVCASVSFAEPNRFQLVVGVITDPDTKEQIPTVFRLDTFTGQTDYFSRTTAPFKIEGRDATWTIEGWYPIAETYAAAFRQYQEAAKSIEMPGAKKTESPHVKTFLDERLKLGPASSKSK